MPFSYSETFHFTDAAAQHCADIKWVSIAKKQSPNRWIFFFGEEIY